MVEQFVSDSSSTTVTRQVLEELFSHAKYNGTILEKLGAKPKVLCRQEDIQNSIISGIGYGWGKARPRRKESGALIIPDSKQIGLYEKEFGSLNEICYQAISIELLSTQIEPERQIVAIRVPTHAGLFRYKRNKVVLLPGFPLKKWSAWAEIEPEEIL